MFVSYYFFFPTICDLIIEFPLCLIFKVHKIGCISLQQMFFFKTPNTLFFYSKQLLLHSEHIVYLYY